MLKFLGAITAIVILTLLRGLVIVKLWAWFLVTTFALPVLNIPQAIGVGLVMSFLTIHEHPEPDETGVGYVIMRGCAYSLLSLFMGWIVHLFM